MASPLNIESEYQLRLDAMTPAERVARSAAMFKWTREQLARQIQAEKGPMPNDVLRWHVALRLYGDEPAVNGLSVRNMIEQRLTDVSD